jgi:predicted ATPase
VFWLVADHLRNREIADRLAISVRTVDSHVAALLTKLAAADRAQLAALATRIRARTSPRRPLPRPLDSFVHRDRELNELGTLVATRRLVTLVGPPGAGKSRLALELARTALTQPPAVFVDLAATQADHDLPHAVLDALGVARTPRPARAALGEALAASHVWLVMDNCEDVADAVGALLHDLLSSIDTLRVLATSQQPLRVAGEAVFAVSPLAVPPDDVGAATELLESPAAQLFADRASAAVAGFDVTADPGSVAALCRRLDGLPLAIELAAARMRTFTPRELLARLDDRFEVLDEGTHGRLPRHRTLEAAIEWSYERLSETEQCLLQRLSVFPAEFQYDDVVAVIAGSELSSSDVARAFPQLVDRSLISRRVREPSGTSYRLLESIRAFAAQRLAGTDPHRAAFRRHAVHYLLAAAGAGSQLLGAGQATWMDWIERHWNDLRQAMRWAMAQAERRDLAWRFIAELGFGWDVLGVRSEVFTWLDDLLALGLPDDGTAATRAAQTAAYLLEFRDTDRALAMAERAVALAERYGTTVLRARANIGLGWCYARHSEASKAAAALHQALDALPERTWDRAFALQGLGQATPDLATALDHFAAAAELFASIGDAVKQVNVRYMMATTCIEEGTRLDDARTWLTQAQRLAVGAGSHHEQLHVAAQLARLDQLQGAGRTARESMQQLLPAFRRIGDRRCVARCLLWLGELEHERATTEQAVRQLTEAVAIAADIHETTIAAAGRRRLAQLADEEA